MRRRCGFFWAVALFGSELKADWPRELFQKSYEQLNQKTHRGRYFITGPQTQTGTFKAVFAMPKSLVWTMVDAASKHEQAFAWSQKDGITTMPSTRDNPDPLITTFDGALGRMAIQSLLSTLHEWRKADSASSKLVNMVVRYENGRQTLSVFPAISLLKGFTWNWIIDSSGKTPKVLEWQIKEQTTEYLFEFEGVKK